MAEADGVLVFDPSGVVKQGKGSVGVARQWCGRVGKIDNCQVGIYMGYVTRKEHALVDVRLYMPKEWMKTARDWTRIEVRPGGKGPLAVEAVKVRVQTKRGRRNGPEETLVVFRERQGRKTVKHDYCLSNASFDTPLQEFARVLDAEHRIEETTPNPTYTVQLIATRFSRVGNPRSGLAACSL